MTPAEEGADKWTKDMTKEQQIAYMKEKIMPAMDPVFKAHDAKAFEKRADCITDQYSGYSPLPGVNLNGKLTLGENTADNGGLRIAYMALLDTLAGKPTPKIDGYTPQQRLFLNWGQVWCTNETDAYLRLQAAINPHSPARHRVNGVVSNMPEFQQAFQCKPGHPMVRKDPCRVW